MQRPEGPFAMKEVFEGREGAPVLYAGLDECTQKNVDTCGAVRRPAHCMEPGPKSYCGHQQGADPTR